MSGREFSSEWLGMAVKRIEAKAQGFPCPTFLTSLVKYRGVNVLRFQDKC